MVTAKYFTFDGISSERYDLMIYYLDDPGVVEETVWNTEIKEERIPGRFDPAFYGLNSNAPLTFTFTIGSTHYLNRKTVEEVLDWLTSHETYKWFEIEQDDMSGWRYKVVINNIRTVSVNGLPFAFKCDVICDSQFAYSYPTRFPFIVKDGQIKNFLHKFDLEGVIDNHSSYNGYIYPKIRLVMDSVDSTFSITNITDDFRTIKINVPDTYVTNDGTTTPKFVIDNKNQIISCNSDNFDVYENFHDDDGRRLFMRLLRGENRFSFDGNGEVMLECEFMRKVGM